MKRRNVETSKRRNVRSPKSRINFRRSPWARGYTVMELAITGMLVAIVAGLAFAPAASVESAEAQSAGRRFSSMIEYGQSLAIARPDQPVLIKVNAAANRFWLALGTSPDTPVTNPLTKQPFLVQLGTGTGEGLEAIRIAGYDFGGDDVLRFDGSGSLDQTGPATIVFDAGGSRYSAVADAWTGNVKVVAAASEAGALESGEVKEVTLK